MPPSSEIQFSSAESLDRGFVNHRPRLSFDGDTVDAWQDWRTQLFPELREQLGPFPDEAFPLNPQIVSTESHDKCTIHKVIYHAREDASIPAYLSIPRGVTAKTPAVLCIHGHVPGGKESVISGDGQFGAPYGRDLAEQGVITLCPDNAGMGERAHPSGGCDFLWRRLNYLGYDLTGYRIYDLMRGVDYLQSLPEVDENRIGIAGFIRRLLAWHRPRCARRTGSSSGIKRLFYNLRTNVMVWALYLPPPERDRRVSVRCPTLRG